MVKIAWPKLPGRHSASVMILRHIQPSKIIFIDASVIRTGVQVATLYERLLPQLVSEAYKIVSVDLYPQASYFGSNNIDYFYQNFRKRNFVSIFSFILNLKLQNGGHTLNIRKSYCKSQKREICSMFSNRKRCFCLGNGHGGASL